MGSKSRILVWGIALLTVLAVAGPPATTAESVGAELNVGFVDDVNATLLATLGLTVLRTIPEIGVAPVWADDPLAATELLLLDPRVEFVEANDARAISGSSWDGQAWDGQAWDHGTMDAGPPSQWGLGAANAPDAWKYTVGTG